MNAASYLPRRDYLALKAATRELVEMAGGVTRAATIARTDAPRLCRYGSPNEVIAAPVDVIADLEAHVGDPVVTRCLADLSGFILQPKDAAEDRPNLLQAAAVITRSSAEVVAGLAVALADSHVSPAEAKALRDGVRQAMESLASLDAALAGIVSEGDRT